MIPPPSPRGTLRVLRADMGVPKDRRVEVTATKSRVESCRKSVMKVGSKWFKNSLE